MTTSSMTTPKVAHITGITGQGGSCPAELLLAKVYVAHGINRRASSINTQRVDHTCVNEVGYWNKQASSKTATRSAFARNRP